MVDEYFELLRDVNMLPKTWSPIKRIQRKMLRDAIYHRIYIELEKEKSKTKAS